MALFQDRITLKRNGWELKQNYAGYRDNSDKEGMRIEPGNLRKQATILLNMK